MFDSRATRPRVLGIDPGLSRCGLAVLEGPRQRPVVIDSDVVRTAPKLPHGQRLRAICDAIEDAITRHRPAVVAVERVFINAQARTGIGAVQVVGMAHVLATRAELPVVEYTPSQVKAAVTGVGDADKEQVMFMVQRLLRLDAKPTPADRADAMAVALCHLDQGPLSGGPAGGMPPRLAAALAEAGPGLAPVSRPGRTGGTS